MPAHALRMVGSVCLAGALAWAPVAFAAPDPPGCDDAVAGGEEIACQLVLGKGKRAPFRGVLLSPAKSKLIQADQAVLEKALDEQKKLTASARAERDDARLESKQVVTDLLQTGQRMERANADLIKASAALDSSNRDLSAALDRMPTTLTLVLGGTLIAVAAFGAGYGIGKLF